jgi:predicted nucleotidyltransferase
MRRYDVIRASLFGSYVRGEQTTKSDIDFLVEFKGRKSLLDLVNLEMELKDLLHKKVDVLTYRSINPLLRDRIMSEQKVIL